MSTGIQGTITTTINDVQFLNYEPFDFSEEIAEQITATKLVPSIADVPFAVSDEYGATGVQLVEGSTNDNDFYLNALVAGNQLVFTSGKEFSVNGASAQLQETGGFEFKVAPKRLSAVEPEDEIFDIEIMSEGAVYHVHTVPETFPHIEITFNNVDDSEKGIYTWNEYGWLMRVDTDGMIVYYRYMNCALEGKREGSINFNFEPHETKQGMFYSYAITIGEFGAEGADEDFFVIMDKNYVECDQVVLMANDTVNHPHGEGDLDFHEIRVLGPKNYIVMGYNRLKVFLPESLTGVDQSNNAYVKAVQLQQQADGKVLWEINSADYPILFENSSENCDYPNIRVTSYSDYMHCNAMDWIEDENGNVKKVVCSFRNQESLVQFDVTDGDAAKIDWIYSGKASTLELDHAYSELRHDFWGNEFESAEWGQHCVRYLTDHNGVKQADNLSVFDNDTGTRKPFTTNGEGEEQTLTRTYCFSIDNNVTKMFNVVDGTHLMDLNKKEFGDWKSYYFGHHCSSVFYMSPTSVMIGWDMGIGDKTLASKV